MRKINHPVMQKQLTLKLIKLNMSLNKIETKNRTKCKLCNNDKFDDFNIHYGHYKIRHPDLLNRCDVCYVPKFGDSPYKDMCFAKV